MRAWGHFRSTSDSHRSGRGCTRRGERRACGRCAGSSPICWPRRRYSEGGCTAWGVRHFSRRSSLSTAAAGRRCASTTASFGSCAPPPALFSALGSLRKNTCGEFDSPPVSLIFRPSAFKPQRKEFIARCEERDMAAALQIEKSKRITVQGYCLVIRSVGLKIGLEFRGTRETNFPGDLHVKSQSISLSSQTNTGRKTLA